MTTYEYFRRQAKLTQGCVAEQIGVTQGAISQWENSVSRPRIDVLLKLSNLYDCTVDDLLCGALPKSEHAG